MLAGRARAPLRPSRPPPVRPRPRSRRALRRFPSPARSRRAPGPPLRPSRPRVPRRRGLFDGRRFFGRGRGLGGGIGGAGGLGSAAGAGGKRRARRQNDGQGQGRFRGHLFVPPRGWQIAGAPGRRGPEGGPTENAAGGGRRRGARENGALETPRGAREAARRIGDRDLGAAARRGRKSAVTLSATDCMVCGGGGGVNKHELQSGSRARKGPRTSVHDSRPYATESPKKFPRRRAR